jgi:hypothetical protein
MTDACCYDYCDGIACSVLPTNGSTVALNSDQLNSLLPGGVGVIEGRIAVVQADVNASTTPPDQECVMDVEVWVEVCASTPLMLLCRVALHHGTVQCGVVWCGVVWCGVVWCGVV